MSFLTDNWRWCWWWRFFLFLFLSTTQIYSIHSFSLSSQLSRKVPIRPCYLVVPWWTKTNQQRCCRDSFHLYALAKQHNNNNINNNNNNNSTTTCDNVRINDRRKTKKSQRRWYGNYKPKLINLKDISKAKKKTIRQMEFWTSTTKTRQRLQQEGTDGIVSLTIDNNNNNNNNNTSLYHEYHTKTSTKVDKKRMESLQHVLTKVVLWALFIGEYQQDSVHIEYDVGDEHYIPDVVAFGNKEPMDIVQPPPPPLWTNQTTSTISTNSSTNHSIIAMWGECGRMNVHKAIDLLERYPHTHIVHCRWGVPIEQFKAPLVDALITSWNDTSNNNNNNNNNNKEQSAMDYRFTNETNMESKILSNMFSYRTKPFSMCSIPRDVWRFVNESDMSIHISKKQFLEWEDLY